MKGKFEMNFTISYAERNENGKDEFGNTHKPISWLWACDSIEEARKCANDYAKLYYGKYDIVITNTKNWEQEWFTY